MNIPNIYLVLTTVLMLASLLLAYRRGKKVGRRGLIEDLLFRCSGSFSTLQDINQFRKKLLKGDPLFDERFSEFKESLKDAHLRWNDFGWKGEDIVRMTKAGQEALAWHYLHEIQRRFWNEKANLFEEGDPNYSDRLSEFTERWEAFENAVNRSERELTHFINEREIERMKPKIVPAATSPALA